MTLGNDPTITVTKQPNDSFYEVSICVPIGLGEKKECNALAAELQRSVAKTRAVLCGLCGDSIKPKEPDKPDALNMDVLTALKNLVSLYEPGPTAQDTVGQFYREALAAIAKATAAKRVQTAAWVKARANV